MFSTMCLVELIITILALVQCMYYYIIKVNLPTGTMAKAMAFFSSNSEVFEVESSKPWQQGNPAI